jgi:hypothetical protein
VKYFGHLGWATLVNRALAETTTIGRTKALDRLAKRCQRDEMGAKWHQCETLWLKALVQLEASETMAAEATLARLLKLHRHRLRWPVVPDCNGCTIKGAFGYPGFGAVARDVVGEKDDASDDASRLSAVMALALASLRQTRAGHGGVGT